MLKLLNAGCCRRQEAVDVETAAEAEAEAEAQTRKMDLEEPLTGTARAREGETEGTKNASFVTDMVLLSWMSIDVRIQLLLLCCLIDGYVGKMRSYASGS